MAGFNNSIIIEWNYFPSYPANGSIYWTYPTALNKVLNLNCCNVHNDVASVYDGDVRVRTYTITNANFTNGSASSNLPLFCLAIGI